MSFGPFGGPDAGNQENGGFGHQSGAYFASDNVSATIVATPFDAAPSAYAYAISPVDGVPVVERYGWVASLPQPSLLSIPFMFRFTAAGALAGFDSGVSICELKSGGDYARRLVLTNDERMQIIDADGDMIGQTGVAYVTKNVDYWFLWYVDLQGTTRDILWVFESGDAWDKPIDVSGHGDGDPANIAAIVFGTSVGKGLPTEGGPFYVCQMAPQILNVSPNTTPVGSVQTKLLLPTGDGDDMDFIAGVGTAPHPDAANVDEVPPNFATDYDEGDAVGEQQSYEVANPGEVPLALQVTGSGADSSTSNTEIKAYIWDGSARDYHTDAVGWFTGYNNVQGAATMTTYNEVNGQPITEALVNGCEPGVEITQLTGGQVARVTTLALEYIVADSHEDGPEGALPGDFPEIVLTNRRRSLAQVA